MSRSKQHTSSHQVYNPEEIFVTFYDIPFPFPEFVGLIHSDVHQFFQPFWGHWSPSQPLLGEGWIHLRRDHTHSHSHLRDDLEWKTALDLVSALEIVRFKIVHLLSLPQTGVLDPIQGDNFIGQLGGGGIMYLIKPLFHLFLRVIARTTPFHVSCPRVGLSMLLLYVFCLWGGSPGTLLLICSLSLTRVTRDCFP